MPPRCDTTESEIYAWMNGRYEPLKGIHNITLTNMTLTDNGVQPGIVCKTSAREPLLPVRVIFNSPATIVIWSDGSKTVVKCHNEAFDYEKGLAMAIVKRFVPLADFKRLLDEELEKRYKKVVKRVVKRLKKDIKESEGEE